MRVFGLFFCVAATALIIPKDAEDRILYTILCKPVPRIDYLMGKVLGVLALTLIAVLLMDAVMTLVLWLRTDTVVAEQIASLKGRYTVEEMQPYLDRIRLQGATWNVQTGLGVMMCEFVVLSSLTLLMSCMTNGTIIRRGCSRRRRSPCGWAPEREASPGGKWRAAGCLPSSFRISRFIP